jgi:hypothetical protein
MQYDYGNIGPVAVIEGGIELTAVACQKRCQAFPGCKFWSYGSDDPNTSGCVLYNVPSGKPPVESPHNTVGPRTC